MSRTAPQIVDAVRPEDYEPGTISRLMVDIAHDGLSQAIRLPVLLARGARPGPVFGVTAAVHGNELNGIPVIQRLFARLDPTQLRGTVVGVIVVNVPGLFANTRLFLDGWDLNHAFPGREDGDAAAVYVHRFVERIVSRFDSLVDLHTASFGRVNSLYVRADMTDRETATMAYLQRPQIILHNPPSDRTLRGAAAELGIPAITLEIGNPQRYNLDFIKRAHVGLRAVLANAGMVRRRAVALGPPPILCERSRWMYTDHGGLLDVFVGVTDHVTTAQRVAHLTNPYGDIIAEYHAPESGVIVGHSVNPVSQTGARILHLGVPALEDDPRFHYRFSDLEIAP